MHRISCSEKNVIVLIEASSGSLDWILPVCKSLKDHSEGIRLHFIMLRYDCEAIFNGNTILKSIVMEISNGECLDMSFFSPGVYRWLRRHIISTLSFLNPITAKTVSFFDKTIWQFYSRKQVFRWMRTIRGPFILLRDAIKKPSNRCNIFIEASERYKGKVVSFPSAPSFTHAPLMWIHAPVKDASDTHFLSDYAMVDKQWDCAYYKHYSRQTVVVGTPKFDTSWIQFLTSRYQAIDHEMRLEDKPIVVLLKNEQSFVFKHIHFRQVLEEILAVLLTTDIHKVVLKPHPRQNMELVKSVIEKYPPTRVSISSDPSFQVMANARYVISMPSGVILDALMMNIPVIEYFDYPNLNEVLLRQHNAIPKNSLGGMTTLDSEGRLTSIFRKKGLVIPANTPEELMHALNKIKIFKTNPCTKKAQEIFYERDAKKAAHFLVNLFDVSEKENYEASY